MSGIPKKSLLKAASTKIKKKSLLSWLRARINGEITMLIIDFVGDHWLWSRGGITHWIAV